VALAALGIAAALASCKTASQAQVTVRTNLSYRTGLNMALWASASGRTDANAPLVQSSEPWLGDGNVGDIVVVPGGAPDGALQLRVVLGVGRDARTCSDADPTGCIVAKRKLAFVPNKQLRVPIVLHLACQGVVCGGDTTCNYLGQCVSSVIEPGACTGAEGCVVAGDETIQGTVPSNDGPKDAGPGVDASLDGEFPTGRPDDAASDAPADDANAAGPISAIAAGGDHACALFVTGQVKCWGRNDHGQLGLGDTQDRGGLPGQMGANLPFVDVDPVRQVKSLSLGNGHTCAVLSDDSLKCWGNNGSGQLGLGDTVDRGAAPGQMGAALPTVDLGTNLSARQLALGFAHSCAVLNDNTLKCWGNNQLGQLGTVTLQDRGDQAGEMGDACPIVDLGGVNVASAAAGDAHSCARVSDNTLRCWGYSVAGQLGTGTRLQGVPLGIPLSAGAVPTAAALGYLHSCALLVGDQVKCWGDNSAGQLGLGDTQNRGGNANSMGPQLPPVALPTGVQRIVAGAEHNCVQLIEKLASPWSCWGKNGSGQLGYGTLTAIGDAPGEVAGAGLIELGVGSVTSMALGNAHTCALASTGAVKCWGDNGRGQLGLGDTTQRGGTAQSVPALLPPVDL
jgi:alpha-tubulin suppressor-like RCC1 family protein